MQLNNSDSSRGVVLVVVLVLFMALSGLTLMTIEVSSRGAVEASRVRSEYEAHFMAEEALFLVFDHLKDDNTPFSDTSFEEWAGEWSGPGVSIHIQPCNAKINLNRFINFASPQQVFSVMGNILPQGTDVKSLLGSLAVWIGRQVDPALAKLDNFYYASQFPSYKPSGGRFKTPEELLLVRGWGDFSHQWVNETFTVWGGRKLNINFVSRETLLAYFPELGRMMDKIIHWRKTRGFTDISQVLSVVGLESDSATYNKMQSNLTVKSDAFEVTVVAQAGDCRVIKRYIVSRPSTFEVMKSTLLYQNDVSVTFVGQ